MGEVVKVGMADLGVALPPDTIRTSGLGSCVGIVIYDNATLVSGLAHIMLPDSNQCRRQPLNEAKYADTAIDKLIDEMKQQGARSFALKAKIAGGAQMFSFASEMMRIGPRNVEAVKGRLNELQIPIVAADVGGKNGRTIEFFSTNDEIANSDS